MRGKTITIYLPDGNPSSIKVCSIKGSMVESISIPRKRLSDSSNLNQLRHVGVYFLLSEKDDFDKIQVYVGEAEDILTRLKQHNNDTNKDYWNKAICFISKSNDLNKAHIKFLENHCYTILKKNEKIKLENSNTPNSSTLIPEERDFILDFFDHLNILIGTLGYPIFQEFKRENVLYCKSKNADATGKYSDDGFTVFKGSKANIEETPSTGKGVKDARKRLIDGNILRQEGNIYVFTENQTFNSPSAAASVVLGREANGWVEWKDKEGVTIDRLHRSND